MKNIRIYNCFFENKSCSFKVRNLKIFLTRTYIFNINGNNAIYYRKTSSKRKLSLSGKSRVYSLNSMINFFNINYSKYGIKRIDNVLNEYMENNYLSYFSLDDSFDILETKRRRIVNVDSFIRKFSNEEIVTMCFDDREYIPNIVGSRIGTDYFNGVNV